MEKKQICMAPFTEVEIDDLGNVNCCCKQYTNNYVFGNLFQGGFEAAWNSEKAKIFRQDILDGKYTWCNREVCNFGRMKAGKTKLSVEAPYPKYVTIGYDKTCNLMCTTCRDCIIRENKMSDEEIDSNINKYFLPICKNAKELVINSVGECFISKHSRNFIQKAVKKYPKIKFNIMTNGIVCNEVVLKHLGLLGHLACIQVSMHAATKKTYDSITRTGNFKYLMKNLECLSKLLKSGEIECVLLNFVVSSMNYKEMPAFVKLGEKFGFKVCFWELQNWNCTEMLYRFEDFCVFHRENPEFKKLMKVLKNPIFDSKYCSLNSLFASLRQESLAQDGIKTREDGKTIKSEKVIWE